jgi:zinc protease
MTVGSRPGPGEPRDYRFPHVERARLANGVRIAVAALPRLPLVTVLAKTDAGATRDPVGREGLSLLASSGIAEGTAKLDGAALAERFERLGSGLESGSDWDDAMAHVTVTHERLVRAMALLGEAVTTPAFRERDIERLKQERIAELLQMEAEPRELADERFAQSLYVPGSRFATSDGGTRSSVEGVTADEVRRFHETYHVPATTTLIFAGDVTLDRAVAHAERALGGWRGDAPAPTIVNDATRGSRRVVLVHKDGAPQSELRIGHRGVPRSHPDYFPIVVMNAILGGLFSSRINLNLREQHAYTYGAHSAFDWRRDAGPFVVSTAVRTDVTAAAVRETLMEIDRIRSETVPADELSLATAYLDGVFPIRYETTQAVASAIAMADTFGLGEDYYTTYRERVRAVTASDVRRAAETYLHPGELLVLAVGDADAIAAPLEALAIGPMDVQREQETP